jgi:hypothetical protein
VALRAAGTSASPVEIINADLRLMLHGVMVLTSYHSIEGTSAHRNKHTANTTDEFRPIGRFSLCRSDAVRCQWIRVRLSRNVSRHRAKVGVGRRGATYGRQLTAISLRASVRNAYQADSMPCYRGPGFLGHRLGNLT